MIQHMMTKDRYRMFEKVPVLTIDQCQGQEADYVVISLVQRPTRFLNKSRFNVALSRVRKELILLTDRNEFRNASRDPKWECHLMARDLLTLDTRDDYIAEDLFNMYLEDNSW